MHPSLHSSQLPSLCTLRALHCTPLSTHVRGAVCIVQRPARNVLLGAFCSFLSGELTGSSPDQKTGQTAPSPVCHHQHFQPNHKKAHPVSTMESSRFNKMYRDPKAIHPSEVQLGSGPIECHFLELASSDCAGRAESHSIQRPPYNILSVLSIKVRLS